ncbi:hypothetical protein CCH79_00006493, partial [Gambusia affinis]
GSGEDSLDRLLPHAGAPRRKSATSLSKTEPPLLRTSTRTIYTAGRPPWYDEHGAQSKDAFVIACCFWGRPGGVEALHGLTLMYLGPAVMSVNTLMYSHHQTTLDSPRKAEIFVSAGLCGGSASGKTTVANKIIEALDVPWVVLLSMDSFYKASRRLEEASMLCLLQVLSPEEQLLAAQNDYNFDHPGAFDFELLVATLRKLKQGKSVKIPVYDFTTHGRQKDWMAAATQTSRHNDVGQPHGGFNVLLKGRLHKLVVLLDDAFNVPAAFCDVPAEPADESDRELSVRALLASVQQTQPLPQTLSVLESSPQVRGLHTIIRNRETSRDEFIFYSKRLMRLLIEHALTFLPSQVALCGSDSAGPGLRRPQLQGERSERRPLDFLLSVLSSPHLHSSSSSSPPQITGVSILRAGETMEPALRAVCKDVRIGKILIQTNMDSGEPEVAETLHPTRPDPIRPDSFAIQHSLHYLRLPKDISEDHVILMDSTVSTGAAAMMAVRVLLLCYNPAAIFVSILTAQNDQLRPLLDGGKTTIPKEGLSDHEVQEEKIMLVSLLMAELGVHSVAYAFPKVKIITTAVDKDLDESFHVIPGIGDFGDRYFGTDGSVGMQLVAGKVQEQDQQICVVSMMGPSSVSSEGGHSAAAASEPCNVHLHAVVEGEDGGGAGGGGALLQVADALVQVLPRQQQGFGRKVLQLGRLLRGRRRRRVLLLQGLLGFLPPRPQRGTRVRRPLALPGAPAFHVVVRRVAVLRADGLVAVVVQGAPDRFALLRGPCLRFDHNAESTVSVPVASTQGPEAEVRRGRTRHRSLLLPRGPSALFWSISTSSSSGGFQMYCSPLPINITSCQHSNKPRFRTELVTCSGMLQQRREDLSSCENCILKRTHG